MGRIEGEKIRRLEEQMAEDRWQRTEVGDQKSAVYAKLRRAKEVSGQTYKSHLFKMMVKCKSFGNAKILHYNIRGTVSK